MTVIGKEIWVVGLKLANHGCSNELTKCVSPLKEPNNDSYYDQTATQRAGLILVGTVHDKVRIHYTTLHNYQEVRGGIVNKFL